MTSSPAAALPSRRSRGARRAGPSTLRRTSEIVLVSGTLLALAAAFGPAWSARLGVAIAVASAVAACVFAWRELFAVERAHARTMLSTSRRHGQQLREEREHNATVVGALSERVQEATATVGVQRGTIVSLRHEVLALESDRSRLRGDVQQRDGLISTLRSTVGAQDATIRGLEERLRDEAGTGEEAGAGIEESAAAEVRHMPRRRAEIDAADAAPEPVDVRTLQTAFGGVLPNYEEDRRLA